jgi:hypothetical protein
MKPNWVRIFYQYLPIVMQFDHTNPDVKIWIYLNKAQVRVNLITVNVDVKEEDQEEEIATNLICLQPDYCGC